MIRQFAILSFCVFTLWGNSISCGQDEVVIGFVSINRPNRIIEDCLNSEIFEKVTQLVNELRSESEVENQYDLMKSLEKLEKLKSANLFLTTSGQTWKLVFEDSVSAESFLKTDGSLDSNRGLELNFLSLLGITFSKNGRHVVDKNTLWLNASESIAKKIEFELKRITNSRRYQSTQLIELEDRDAVVQWYFGNPAKSSRGKKDPVGFENLLSLSGQIDRTREGNYEGTLLLRIAQPADKVGKMFSFGRDLGTVEKWVPRDVMTYSTLSLDFKKIIKVFYADIEGESLARKWPFVRHMHLLRALSRAVGHKVESLMEKYCTGRISWIFGSTKLSKVNFQTMATCFHVHTARDAANAVQWMLNDAPFSKTLKPVTYNGVVIAYQKAGKPRQMVMHFNGDFVDAKNMSADTPCRNADWCYFALGSAFFLSDSLEVAKACIDTHQGNQKGLAEHSRIKVLTREDRTKGLYAFMLKELFSEIEAAAKDKKVRHYFGELLKESTKNKLGVSSKRLSALFKKSLSEFSDVVPNIVFQVKQRPDGVLVKFFGT